MDKASRLELRAELIRIAKKRQVAALREFVVAHPEYDADLTAAVGIADDEALLVLLVTMASLARERNA